MERLDEVADETLGGFAYEYDAVGRIVLRSHAIGSNAFDRVYAYDDLDRLASDGGVTYTYDAAGNCASRTEDGETVSYALGQGDRLASWTGGSYTYDAAGCVTRITRGADTWDLAWNGQYQLVSVSTNGVFAESYEYDALGRRVSTTTIEGTTRHVYDDRWQVVADLDEQNNVVASYTWGDGIDGLLSVKVGGESYYPLTDVQGTVWGYVDSQDNVVARWRYDAWGNVVDEFVAVPALANIRYRFQCREWSAATGLTNFRMRWYDSWTGRWLSKDPIGIVGGLNLYGFCDSDPINFTDADGLGKVSLLMKTAKGMWKYISRSSAIKKLREGKDVIVTMTGDGRSKKAKRILEEAKGKGKRIVRHDGHKPGQAAHFQPKHGDGTHIRLPGAHLTSGSFIGEVLDFFNPISDIQDIIDLFYDEEDLFCEEEGEHEK